MVDQKLSVSHCKEKTQSKKRANYIPKREKGIGNQKEMIEYPEKSPKVEIMQKK